MTRDLEVMGPALRLIYKYLSQPDITDAEKIAFAGGLLSLVGEHQVETQRELMAAIEAAGVVPERPTDWTAEDDRQVMVGRIADTIERMPADKLERVLVLAQHIRDE